MITPYQECVRSLVQRLSVWRVFVQYTSPVLCAMGFSMDRSGLYRSDNTLIQPPGMIMEELWGVTIG